jgi:hypothetical protein
MLIYDYCDPSLENGRKNKEFSRGELLIEGDGAIQEIPFNYADRTPRGNYATLSAGIPTEYTRPTEVIFTSRLDLQFLKGQKVRLNDGNIMTVKDTSYEHEANKAYFNGDGRTGWLIVFEGGV